MERRSTDRKVLLEQALTAMWYFFAHNRRPITGKWNSNSHLQSRIQSRLNFSFCDKTCGNPVHTIPLFVTRNVISQHDVFLGILCAAVNRLQKRVLAHLERAESKEADVWRQQDYRTAQITFILADEGQGNPYSKAFCQLFGKNAHEVRFWWRDRQKLYRLCEAGGSATPLLHANLAKELGQELIPDYDPTLQVSPDSLTPETRLPAKKPASLPTRAERGAGSPEKSD